MKLLCSRPSQPGPRRWIKSFWPRTACSSFPHAHQVPSTTSASKPPLSSNLYKSLTLSQIFPLAASARPKAYSRFLAFCASPVLTTRR
ncbi:hypothetical protein LMH87_004392 [Akanthomyces muscarius]|uniref:Uncharacterized protein n=1 Tax=Akanthomyces muscarius TaxID=2231603 RepID=A0A9W8UI16_AKAMU|nr:hypothetical protein LMH87_004392 [Akanthomyces muscarius]KAJ4145544.1 hypothetical protein LMH87_004392 [Akanthomyces muscarius]